MLVEADLEGGHCADPPACRGRFEGTVALPEDAPLRGAWWYLVR